MSNQEGYPLGMDEKAKSEEETKFDFWVGAGIVAVVVVFVLSLAAGGLLLFCGPIDRLGNFGDFFGFFSGVVSAVGFGAVIYQLQRQHKDAAEAEQRYREERENQQREAKETEQRHREILEKQQKLFEQNSKIRLFEHRFKVHEASTVLFGKILTNELKPICHEDITTYSKDSSAMIYLFPHAIDLHTFNCEIIQVATDLWSSNADKTFKEQFPNEESPIERNLSDTQIREWIQRTDFETIGRLFHDYLVLDERPLPGNPFLNDPSYIPRSQLKETNIHAS